MMSDGQTSGPDAQGFVYDEQGNVDGRVPNSHQTTKGAVKQSVLSVRIRPDLKARLDQPRIGPYRVSITDLVERGIELALAELEDLQRAK